MEPAMTWGVATEAETTVEVPLSPELVLVSPDLRERALRELTLPHESNGTRPHPLLLRDFARLHAAEPEEIEVSLLRGAGEAIVQVAVFAALFVLVVAGAAFGLTIAPGETEPELASRPASLRPDAPGIGTAAVHGDVSVERQQGRVRDPWRHSPGPIGLTTQGQLVWNLDALVRDVFGSRPACLLYAPNQLSVVACSASPPGGTAYRTTFTGVDRSGFRLSNRSTPPTLRAYAVPLKLRTSYLSCGRGRWVAATANRALSCERELSRPER
jgi:hypothetical protein